MTQLLVKPTVEELWTAWLKERDKDKFNNSVYNANWKALQSHFGNLTAELITTDECPYYAKKRFAGGMRPWTVHTELARLRTCSAWSFSVRKIPFAPKIWVPQPGGSRQRVLSHKEAVMLLDAALQGEFHIYLFMALLFATGARHRAVLDLQWERIDFVTGTINYDNDLPLDPMSKAWRKGRAKVPMNATARAALELAFKTKRTDHVVEFRGKRLTDVREGFREAVKRAGLWHVGDRITPHTIRHTVATWLEANAVSDKRRAQLLGHVNARVTNEVYTHASHELLLEAVSHLDFAPLPKLDHIEASEACESVEKPTDMSQRDKGDFATDAEIGG